MDVMKSAVLESLHVSAETTIRACALLLHFYFSYCPRNLQTPSNSSSYKSSILTAFRPLWGIKNERSWTFFLMKLAALTLFFFCAPNCKRLLKWASVILGCVLSNCKCNWIVGLDWEMSGIRSAAELSACQRIIRGIYWSCHSAPQSPLSVNSS